MASIASHLFKYYINFLGLKRNGLERWTQPDRNPKAFKAPNSFHSKYDTVERTVQGRKVYTYTPKASTNNKHIIFFHGGAYAAEITIYHWRFVEQVIDQTDCKVTLIEYPLIPEHTHVQTFEMVREAYALLTKDSSEDFLLMGDSAGGGLSMALAQLIQQEGIMPSPSKLVLLSPWIDASMSIPVPADLDKKDRILNFDAIKATAKMYAGDADLKHHLMSPFYGDFDGLCEIGIWCGTSEMFIVDMPRLKQKLESANVPYRYHEAPDMQHDYPLFPIPEGKKAVKEICNFINGN